MEEILARSVQDNKILEMEPGLLTAHAIYDEVREQIFEQVSWYHEAYPMRAGCLKPSVCKPWIVRYRES